MVFIGRFKVVSVLAMGNKGALALFICTPVKWT